ncbi:MAG: endonuclease [Chloroflexi bacterium]|nr:endonuclease [Chloroflexota bacterium]
MRESSLTNQKPPFFDEALKEYDQVINRVFESLHAGHEDVNRLPFSKSDVERAVSDLGLSIKNIPDIVYTYRSGRSQLPQAILTHRNWAIEGVGKGKYAFTRLTRSPYVDIPTDVEIVHILDATPQLVLKYQGTDEQGFLARIRYNRLIDTFTALTAYHIQGHFRTTISDVGQVEIDDLYIGIDTDGHGFVLPIEAKGESPRDQLGVIQIIQMVRFARQYFADLIVRPIGVKIMPDGSYMFLEFNDSDDANLVATKRYKRYVLCREQ